MLERVIVSSSIDPSSSLELVLRAPEKSGVLIDSIEGLSQERTEVGISQTAAGRNVFSRAYIPSRNIVFKLIPIGLDLEEQRSSIQRIFRRGYLTNMVFVGSHKTVTISGFVETFLAPMFTKQNVIDISVLCPDPSFRGEDVSIDVDTSVLPHTVVYDGEVEVGFEIHIPMPDTNLIVEIRDTVTNGVVSFKTADILEVAGPSADPLEQGLLIFSSVAGSRSFKLMRGIIGRNMIGVLNEDLIWPTLKPGENNYEVKVISDVPVEPQEPEVLVSIDFQIRHQTLYGGI